MSTGVLLYGPPASGKDTVTTALAGLSPRYALFRRLKCGAGRTDGYRMVDQDRLRHLTASGDVVWRNEQYSATYAVDRSGLDEALRLGTPVLHIGQAAAIDAVMAATPATTWFVVALWCERDIAAARLHGRGSTDLDDRLRVWDSTPPLVPPATTFNTGIIAAQDLAHLIRATVDRIASVPVD